MEAFHLQHFLSEVKVVAVIRRMPAAVLENVVDALVAGGIRGLEVTLDSPGAIEGIAHLNAKYGNQVVIGAGTVFTEEQVTEAVGAGAKFLVCPHFDRSLVQKAQTLGVPLVPGVLTPTEIGAAKNAGAAVVKVFPAGSMGPSYIKDLLGPFGGLQIMATGGITEENAKDFLRSGAVAVGVGSALFPQADIASANWRGISERAARILANLV